MRSVLVRFADKTSKFATAACETTSVSTTPLSLAAGHRCVSHTSVYSTRRATTKVVTALHQGHNIRPMASSTCSSGDSVPTSSVSNDKPNNPTSEKSEPKNGTETEKLHPLSAADFKIYNQMADVMERFVSSMSTFLLLFSNPFPIFWPPAPPLSFYALLFILPNVFPYL